MLKLFFYITLFITYSYAHPHTFIDVYPKVIQKNGYVEKIDIKWSIDEMTSSMLIMEFDQNGNGKIDNDENNYVEENYFSTLKDYDFYMKLKPKYKVISFKAKIQNNRIQYIFSIVPLTKTKLKNFSISFYDTDFFVAMVLKEEFVKQKIPHKVEDIDSDFYYGYKITYK